MAEWDPRNLIPYFICWLPFPPWSLWYIPLKSFCLFSFLSLPISNQFLFFLTVLFSSGSVASSLHLPELLIISHLSWILRALAFCLLIKGAVILKCFLFPALKQTYFYYFNKICLQQSQSIKTLDCKSFDLAVFVFQGKYEHIVSKAECWKPDHGWRSEGTGLSSRCLPEFWPPCAFCTAMSLWEPPFTRSCTYCKGIG